LLLICLKSRADRFRRLQAGLLIQIKTRVGFREPNGLARKRDTGKRTMKRTMLIAAGTILALAAPLAGAQAVDEAAATALMKKSGCLKCHSVTAKKEGPSFRETAAKYKGKPDAEKALYTHLTTSPTIKVDGVEEPHDPIKTKDEAQIRNVVHYILSR
jgi:cytochrome c